LRRKFNGFDILVAVVVVVALLFLARKALPHTGTLVTQHEVTFTVTSMATQNVGSFEAELVPHGTVMVSAAGSFIPFGTLKSVTVIPYVTSIANGQGKLVRATDPVEKQMVMTVATSAVVSAKKVTINGNPFLLGQELIMQEGGAQISGFITGIQAK
jgi:hypothetical protein